MNDREPLLALEDVAKHYPSRRGPLRRTYGTVRAVDGVTLAVRRGETLGLVGESGCGKSTLVEVALALQKPTAGRVRFDGEDVHALRGARLKAFRRRAQVVFQDPLGTLNPRLTARRALEEVLRVHGLAQGRRGARASELFELVGLGPEHLRRYPHEFSGGQRQRLAIARALAVEPGLLILDEPVSALDGPAQARILNLLADLQSELGLTYLFVAHDLTVVEHVSDRVAVMYLGRIVELASAESLYRDPRHPYTRALMAAAPRLGDDPGSGPPVPRGEVPRALERPRGCPYQPRCAHPAKDRACTERIPLLEGLQDGRSVACIKES